MVSIIFLHKLRPWSRFLFSLRILSLSLGQGLGRQLGLSFGLSELCSEQRGGEKLDVIFCAGMLSDQKGPSSSVSFASPAPVTMSRGLRSLHRQSPTTIPPVTLLCQFSEMNSTLHEIQTRKRTANVATLEVCQKSHRLHPQFTVSCPEHFFPSSVP